MTSIRFRAGDVDLELSGSEAFVTRQLLELSPFLGRVDPSALGRPTHATPASAPVEREAPAEPAEPAGEESGNGRSAPAPSAPAPDFSGDSGDSLVGFFEAYGDHDGADRQAEAALLFSYYLQRREGMNALQMSDLIRCCIRAGVDTRNFNRTLGALTRRGLFETVRQGQSYRLSDQGVAAVEKRLQ